MQTRPAPFWRSHAGGLAVAIRVQPRARRAGLGGAVPDAAGSPRLRIAVTEPPEDGRATRAACAALSAALGLPARDVTVLHGAGSREKLLLAAGDAAAGVGGLNRQRQGWPLIQDRSQSLFEWAPVRPTGSPLRRSLAQTQRRRRGCTRPGRPPAPAGRHHTSTSSASP